MFHGNTPIAQAPVAFSVDNTAQPQRNLPEYPWWQDLGSAELNRLVLEALENNQKVSMAVKNIEIAQSALDTVRLGWLPSINLMAGGINTSGSAVLPNLPIPLSNAGNFLAFLPTWMVNIIQLPNQTKQAEKNVQATASEYLAVRTSIAAQVVSSYAVLLSSIEEEKVLAAMENNLRARMNTARSMALRGLGTEVSFIELDSEMQKLQAQIAGNRSNQTAAKNALLNLVGRQLASYTPREAFSVLKLDQVAPGNTPTSVLESRPDVASARAKIEAADYGVSSTVSLFAPVPTFSTANVRATDNSNGTNSVTTASLRTGMLMWVLDPQFIGRINTQNKRYDSAILNYLTVVDNALKETDDALAKFEASQTKLVREENSLANAGKNLATMRAMYKSGLIPNTKYLEGSARFELAQIAILQTKVEAVIAFSKLYQNMGGGATYAQEQYRLEDQALFGKKPADSQN